MEIRVVRVAGGTARVLVTSIRRIGDKPELAMILKVWSTSRLSRHGAMDIALRYLDPE